ncbi:MAG: class I SAM-dependent rRNA methyltransferase, partial [Deltaproteobacteria bacterium]|nr:class I SAM-dependent rRNA methyltransferase [Deltaproteobacteria bacterium]
MTKDASVPRHLQVVRLTPKGLRWRRTGHPWVYRNDLEDLPETPAGDLVAVAGPDGRILGQAFYSAASRIALRMV